MAQRHFTMCPNFPKTRRLNNVNYTRGFNSPEKYYHLFKMLTNEILNFKLVYLVINSCIFWLLLFKIFIKKCFKLKLLCKKTSLGQLKLVN